MNDREFFHESVVRDVVDVVSSMKDYDEVQFIMNSNKNRSFKSISSATKDLILTFPLIAGADADPDNVSMAAKAHEKKCASMLHMLFTALCVSSNEDVFDFVKKFHNNMGAMNSTLDDYADSLDKLAATLDEGFDQTYQIDKDAVNAVLEDLRQSNYTLPDDIKEESVSDFSIVPGYVHGTKDMIIKESRVDTGKALLDSAKKRESEYKMMSDTMINAKYEKANELMPTMMVINFMKKNDTGVESSSTCIIGVKVKVYPVTSTDICNRISSKVEDKNVLNSFIRATTNEIAFFRDFLFAIDKAKIDAMSYGREATSNKMWKVLERRTTKSKFRRSLKMYNDATAISTLCITSNTAAELKESYSIDIMNPSVARKILDAYNFMCICVLNEATEVANFLYDTGDDNYERLTFSNMEREASDNSYKKVVNLLTKMNR
jgi:hypothetical protein